jgi:hypothetical protein
MTTESMQQRKESRGRRWVPAVLIVAALLAPSAGLFSSVAADAPGTSGLAQMELELFTGYTERTWGSGTLNADDPFNTWWHDSRAESVIKASELATPCFELRTIEAISVRVNQLPGVDPLRDFRVRLQDTVLNDRATGNFITTGYSLGFGPTNIARADLTEGGWYRLTLHTPFTRAGSDNLLLDLSRDGVSFVSGGGIFARDTPGEVRTAGFNADSSRVYPFDGAPNTRRAWVPALKVDGLWDAKCPPGAPEDLAAAPGSELFEVALSWTAPSDTGGVPITAYNVYRSLAADGPYALVATLDGAATEHTDTGDLLTTYYYQVTAVNAAGEGEASQTACTKPYPWVSLDGDNLCDVPNPPL